MNNKRPIVLATDGSPSGGEAQQQAFDLARLTGAPLLVVSVSHATLPAMGYTAYGYSQAMTEIRSAEHERVRSLLDTTAEAAVKEGIACTTEEGDGAIVEEICRIAAEHDAQLVVVGSHGWGATRRLLSGSVSTGLVHSAPCPVLVVRQSAAAERAAA